MSDNPQPADWAIKSFTGVHQDRPRNFQTQGVEQSRMDQFTAWNENVAGKDALAAGDVAVAGSAVNGTVATNSVGIAPASSVAVKQTNMLVSQSFTSPNTVVSSGQWSWWGEDGHLALGCARVDCNGLQDDLVSNEILVVKDENIEVTVVVKWVGLDYTGTEPIVLGVEKYRKGKDPDSGGTIYMDVGSVNIDTVTSPADTGGWLTLTGTYVVPARVDQLRFRFSAPNATGGYVLWDEAVFEKTDLIPDEAVPGVGRTVDNVVTQLNGQTGSGFTHDDEAAALSNTAQALTANASSVSQIQAEAGTGTIAGDDFTYTGSVLSHGWGGTNVGAPYFAGDGNNAVWQLVAGVPANTGFPSYYDWQGAGATSSTDYQKIQLVLASGNSNGGSVSLYGRISSGWTSYILLSVGYGYYTLYGYAGGVLTVLDSGSCAAPGAGATITLYCGDKATTAPRQFRAEINGSTICNYTDTSTTNYGASYRKWGWGGNGYWSVAFGYGQWIVPASVNQWIGVDQ